MFHIHVSILYPPQTTTKALSNEQCSASCFGFWVGGCKQIIANHSQKTRHLCSSIIHFWIPPDFSSFQGWNEPGNISNIFFESFDRSVSSLSWAYGLTPYHCCLFMSQNMRSLEDVNFLFWSGKSFIQSLLLITWLWYGFSLRIQSGLWAAMGFPVTDPVSRRNWCLGMDMIGHV